MSLPRFREPNREGRNYYYSSLGNNPNVALPYATTITNLGGILSTNQLSTQSQILPSTFNERRADPPTTHVYEHEIEIARWQARKRIKQRQSRQSLTCSVCLEAMEPLVWVRPTAFCAHEPRICSPCLGQYVMHSIQEGLTEVFCPDVGCRHRMNGKDVMGYIRGDPASLNRYKTLKAQRELENQPNFVWCQNPRCGRGQIHNKGDALPLVVCHYCRSSSCFIHRIPWHNGMTCQDYNLAILHDEEVQASEDYLARHTKQCPHCRRPIEKITGCDHMTCLRPGGCGHQFCWICLADYGPILQDGNHRHNLDCAYYTGNRSSLSGRSSTEDTFYLRESYYELEGRWISDDETLENVRGLTDAHYHRRLTPIHAHQIEGSSESSTNMQFERLPAPVSPRMRNHYAYLATLNRDRPSYKEVWRPPTPPIPHSHNRRDAQIRQEWSTRMSEHVGAHTRQLSYTEVWWPPTPPLPRADINWHTSRR